MTDENLTAQRRIDAPPATVFAVLADPANHVAIDGTGWVRGPRQEGVRITAEGEVFDMAITPEARERFQFPPFGVEKLTESLENLAMLAS